MVELLMSHPALRPMLVLLTACSQGTTASTFAGGPGDAGAPQCPAAPPSTGTTCRPDGLQCEYGSVPDIGCDTVVECRSGVWAPSSLKCSSTCDLKPLACPSSGGPVASGQACAAGTTICADHGRECSCAAIRDAGPTWSCLPQDGCPVPRPRLGIPCSAGALTSCVYSNGAGCQFYESCTGAAWSASSMTPQG
jgi:hypothetical protein